MRILREKRKRTQLINYYVVNGNSEMSAAMSSNKKNYFILGLRVCDEENKMKKWRCNHIRMCA